MYRTDKQFMKNPATASSRIYIGGLNKTVVADDLEAKFKVHGNILGLVLNSGFAFIQFETEEEAYSAIKSENNSMLQGRKMIVKQALDKSRPAGTAIQGPPQRQGGPPLGRDMGPPQKPSFSPKQNNPPPQKTPPQKTPPPPQAPQQTSKNNLPDMKFQPPERELDFQEDNVEDDGPNIRPPGPPQHNNRDNRGDQDRDRGRKGIGRQNNRGGRGRSNDRDRDRGRFDDRFEPPMGRFDRDPYYDDRDRDYPPPGGRPVQFIPPLIEAPPPPEKNDCEIIVVSKALTEYAEFIEQKLKTLGLVVDLLFPNEDVPIGKVLANISSRGCLYAILVMPINEEHRSLTLNILHGIPQEHRNMPVEDAMILISRNFESYMKGEHIPAESVAAMVLNDRHPTPMQMMINLLSENRQLSTTQYDNLIKYLQERRILQHEYEIAEGIQPDSQEGDSKEAELQNRIMNILNKSTDAPIPTSITAPEPNPTPSNQPILKDPTVQKALDSLLLGDMFKNIAGNA